MFNQLVKRRPLGLLYFVLPMLLLLESSAPTYGDARPQPDLTRKNVPDRGVGVNRASTPSDLASKKVLILHSFAYAQPAYKIIDAALIESFASSGLNFNNLYFEFLDLARNPGQEYRHEVAETFRKKFKGLKLDLVLALHQEALQFLLKEGKDIYPEGPVISTLGDSTFSEHSDLKRPVIHLPVQLDVISTVKEILKLKPNTQKIVVIAGGSNMDRRFENFVRGELETWKGALDVESFPPVPLAEILRKVGNLPTGTAILYTTVYADSTGQTYMPPDVARMISKTANAPVFGLYETLLGNNGVVGGIMTNHRVEGERAVRAAVEILHGKVPQKPLTILPAPSTPMFDWQQLERWGFKESSLSANAIILNRPVSPWERYKLYIIAAIVFFVFETTLIILLMVQRRRKKVAEEGLRQKKEELDQFFNVNLDVLCIANTDGYFLHLNPAMERILGYTREELMAQGFSTFIHPDDLDKTREAVSTLASQQKVYSFENRYRCKDGSYRWLQWSSVPAGKLIYAAARDVTEHKQAEEDLKKSEERFRMLVETMNEGLGVRNENGVWTYVNDQLCWMLGLLPGDIIGRPVTEFLDEANQKILREEIRKQEKGNYSPYEITWTHIDGRKVTTIVSPKPILNSDGQPNEVFVALTDITDRKHAEEALRQSEERFRQVAENVGDFIWEVDASGLYHYTSPSVEKILGYKPDELVGKRHFYDLFAPGVREELKAAALKVFAAKRPFRTFPNPNISKEGNVVHLETKGAPVLDEAGNLSGYRGADTDVTKRKEAEEELRRYRDQLEEMVKARTAELVVARDEAESANRAKSTFLANMSHELRTPLNSILGIAQLMERDAGFPSHHRDTLKILSRSGAFLLELINDVLEMSKVEAGKVAPVITSFDLHSFLGDLEEMIRLRADPKGLCLLFEQHSSLPQYIETDLRKLRQILVNLLSNAIKYTDKGGVTLRIALKEGMNLTAAVKPVSPVHLKFEIEDTGIGIAPEDTQRIFEPFVQVNPGLAARDGTGLGLTLSRMFVEQLGGEINLFSQVGKGSIFAFDIPVKLAEGAVVRTPEADRKVIGPMPGQPSYRLLIVDDSVENRFVLRRLLEQGGFTVLEAAGGQEAINLYKSDPPHLIWMDLRMPGTDGNEAARRIRELESGMRTPIIALTAGVMDDEERPSHHGRLFDDWVYKPFRETEIFGKLEQHLGVQFVYQPSVESATGADKNREKKVTPADLAVLPVEWLKEFFNVLRRGRSAQLIDLIGRISEEHADLAGTLAELVDVYRFDNLIVATEGALKEASNG